MNVSRLSDVSLDLLLTFLLLGCSAQTLLIIHPRVILLFQHKHSPEIYVESGFDFRKMLHIFDFAVKQQTQSWFLNLNSSVQIPQRFSHQLLLLQQLLQIWKRSFMFSNLSAGTFDDVVAASSFRKVLQQRLLTSETHLEQNTQNSFLCCEHKEKLNWKTFTSNTTYSWTDSSWQKHNTVNRFFLLQQLSLLT